jgi:hypothetical protein
LTTHLPPHDSQANRRFPDQKQYQTEWLRAYKAGELGCEPDPWVAQELELYRLNQSIGEVMNPPKGMPLWALLLLIPFAVFLVDGARRQLEVDNHAVQEQIIRSTQSSEAHAAWLKENPFRSFHEVD